MKLPVLIVAIPLLLSSLAPRAMAQTTPLRNNGAATANATPALVAIQPEFIASLPTVAADSAVRAMSIEVTQSQLQADAGAVSALRAWVRNGGIVMLHTDAAQLFGYATVAVRESTPQLPGQLFGRAKSALPFGGHPLLWGAVARSSSTDDVAAASAVRTVYYQARPGDQLVTSHPRGVPLLQLVEPAGASRAALYAAAIAPYGRGWAIFTPSYVESQRGDGALFLANLLSFADVPVSAPPGGARPARVPDLFVGLPAAWLETAAQSARGDNFSAASQARSLVAAMPAASATAGSTATSTTTTSTTTAATDDTAIVAPLAIRTSERNDLWRALSGNAAGARAQLLVLRARLALQSGDFAGASRWHSIAEDISPNAPAVKVWGGALSAAEAANRTLASPARAALMVEAVNQWNAALGSSPQVIQGDDDGEATPAPNSTVPGVTIGGVSRDVVAFWAREGAYAARLAAAEPPLISVVGDVVVRFYQGDASLRLALPAAARLSVASRALGMAVDDEELLLFAAPEELVAYRAARGGGGGGAYGDVSGSKILMVSRPATIVFLPPLRPGGPRRPVVLGSTLPTLIGRLHGQLLVNRLAAGGAPIPVWLQVGLESVASQTVVGDNTNAIRTQAALRTLATTGQLLTPVQFESLAAAGGNEAQTAAADAQAAWLVTFFAARFGTGTLIETLQRLGAGEEFSAALSDTTGTTEEALFRAWSNAAFGI